MKTLKALLVNGSPRANGCTFTALTELKKTLEAEGIEVELIHVGHRDVRGCIACRKCQATGKCVFDDVVNEVATDKQGRNPGASITQSRRGPLSLSISCLSPRCPLPCFCGSLGYFHPACSRFCFCFLPHRCFPCGPSRTHCCNCHFLRHFYSSYSLPFHFPPCRNFLCRGLLKTERRCFSYCVRN